MNNGQYTPIFSGQSIQTVQAQLLLNLGGKGMMTYHYSNNRKIILSAQFEKLKLLEALQYIYNMKSNGHKSGVSRTLGFGFGENLDRLVDDISFKLEYQTYMLKISSIHHTKSIA